MLTSGCYHFLDTDDADDAIFLFYTMLQADKIIRVIRVIYI